MKSPSSILQGGIFPAPTSSPKQANSRRASIYTDFFARSSSCDSFIENNIHPTVILAMLYFQEAQPGIHKLRQVLGERLLKIERFRAIFREENKKIYYDIAAKEDVDLMHHIREFDGEGVFGEDELIEKIRSATLNYWDPEKPLWDVTLITNLKDGESRSVLLCRIDHAIGDGVALTGVLQSLLDDPPSTITTLQRRRATKPEIRLSHRIVSFFTGCYQGLIGWLLIGYDPDNGLKLPREIAMSSTLATAQGKILTRAKSFPLDDLKAMKNKLSHGVSINDLLLAVLTVSVRQYLETTQDPVLRTLKERNKTLHANFLMNTRHTSKSQKQITDLTNDFIVVSYPFPLNYESVLDAVWRCKSIVDEYKISPVLFLMKHVTCKLLSFLPESLLVFAAIDNNLKPTCFISNVIGPSYESSMGGYTITDLDFLVSANISLYFGIVSYQDKVRISITADKRANVNVGLLKDCIGNSFDRLKTSVDEAEGQDLIPSIVVPKGVRILEVFVTPVVFVGVLAYIWTLFW